MHLTAAEFKEGKPRTVTDRACVLCFQFWGIRRWKAPASGAKIGIAPECSTRAMDLMVCRAGPFAPVTIPAYGEDGPEKEAGSWPGVYSDSARMMVRPYRAILGNGPLATSFRIIQF